MGSAPMRDSEGGVFPSMVRIDIPSNDQVACYDALPQNDFCCPLVWMRAQARLGKVQFEGSIVPFGSGGSSMSVS